MDSRDVEIQKILGRALEPERRATIKNLNEVPRELIEEARKLSPSLGLQFLEHYVHDDEAMYIDSFHERVVEGGQDPETWLRGGILVVNLSLAELLAREVPAILDYLEPRPDEAWSRVRPTWGHWSPRDSVTGAPAVQRPDLDYHYTPPRYIYRFFPVPFAERLEPVRDVTLATRRWIATYFAREAEVLGLLGKVWDLGALIAAVTPDATRLSTDASIALRALLFEQRELGVVDFDALDLANRDALLPGFRGPDEWYAGFLPGDG